MEFLFAKAAGYIFSDGISSLIGIGSIGIFGMAALYILKRIPNDKIKAVVRATFYALGVASTLGLAKWKYTKRWWNKLGEPFLVDLINNTIVEAAKAYIEGMRSDNA